MGSNEHYIEERPMHGVSIDGFWLDRSLVTNREYAEFVETTGYVTVAERELNPEDYPGADPKDLVPGSLVFQRAAGPVDLRDYRNWWHWTFGAYWRAPQGPGSSIDGLDDHPVVHIAYEDAEAFAEWAGKSLPTEVEWERASRGSFDGALFPWGNDRYPDGEVMANTWEGEFPWENSERDGYVGTSPVGNYPPNAFGMYDPVGNVWEWTRDWWSDQHPSTPEKACCMPESRLQELSLDRNQPHIKIPQKVLKGGSHLCADNYCLRYRPAARHAQMIDSGTTHIGFRCVVRPNGSD